MLSSVGGGGRVVGLLLPEELLKGGHVEGDA